jgi:hypothetical protein
MEDNNNFGMHTFIHCEKSNLKNPSKFKGTKLVTSKDVGQQQSWIHTFVSGERSYLKLTLELKETYFIISKMWGNKGAGLHTLYMVKN